MIRTVTFCFTVYTSMLIGLISLYAYRPIEHVLVLVHSL